MKIQINGREVFVYGESVNTSLKSKLFQDWLVNLDPSFNVQDIEFQSVDYARDDRILFIKFRATVLDENGEEIPGVVLLRGGTVAILIVLVCEGDEYTVLVRQRRFPSGNISFPEIPAGMLDGDSNFVGVAIKEVAEETGIEIDRDNIIDLTNYIYGPSIKGVFSSVGISDEYIRYFLIRQTVDREYLDGLKHKLTGAKEENEQIRLEVITLSSLPFKSPDSKSLSAFAFYQIFKKKLNL